MALKRKNARSFARWNARERIQNLFFTDRKRCFDEVFEGAHANVKCEIDKPVLEKYFATNAAGPEDKGVILQPPPWLHEIIDLRPRPCTAEEDVAEEVTQDEFDNHVNSLQNTSPGWDGIDNQLIRNCPSIRHFLFCLIKLCVKTSYVPQCWRQGHIILLYKGGDVNAPPNWRPICLQSALYKVLATIMVSRVMKHHQKLKKVEGGIGLFSDSQKGFVEGVDGCATHSFSFQTLYEDARQRQVPFNRTYYDMVNAFNRIPHSLIQWAMDYLHIPKYIQSMRMCTYVNNTVQV